MKAVERLTCCNYSLRPTLEQASRAALAPAPEAPALDEGNQGDDDDEHDDSDDSDEEAEEEPMEVAPLDSHEVKLAAEQILPPPPPPQGFVVSVSRRGKLRRLHLVEACRLTPGVHYKDYEVLGATSCRGRATCTQCARDASRKGSPQLARSRRM